VSTVIRKMERGRSPIANRKSVRKISKGKINGRCLPLNEVIAYANKARGYEGWYHPTKGFSSRKIV
jgi:hypothetical protein